MKTLFFLGLSLFTLVTTKAQSTINFDIINSEISFATNIQNTGDERLFVTRQNGIIEIINSNGELNPDPFLDISHLIENFGELGLLGLAFHPNYNENGYFYVNYNDLNWDTQISRFQTDPTNPNFSNPNTEVPILKIEIPHLYHYGGCMAFGSDGYLYISVGDGGSFEQGQNTAGLNGNMLRLDINNPQNGNNYGIPAGNPFIDDPDVRDEIWAYGLRNPWRFSLDEIENNIWIGDVGDGSKEEINRSSLENAGINYGWRCYEGTVPVDPSQCSPTDELTFPVLEYERSPDGGGTSVIGGYVYRGNSMPDMAGHYFFADAYQNFIGILDPQQQVHYIDIPFSNLYTFGLDNEGELYASTAQGIVKITQVTLTNNDYSILGVTMHPNPADNEVTIDFPQGTIESVQILDIRGSVITTKNINSDKATLNISGIAEGIYMVRIESELGTITTKKLAVK